MDARESHRIGISDALLRANFRGPAPTWSRFDSTQSTILKFLYALNTQPKQTKQIDLFSAAPNTCLLTALGSNAALRVGAYQQIRLLLVPNDGGGSLLPVSNASAGQGFNLRVSSCSKYAG